MKLQSLLVASVLSFGIASGPAAPLGTSFTYQGRLTDGAQPANGTYAMLFELYDALVGGTRVATPTETNTVVVSNGLFAVDLDFGVAAFTGGARWLEIIVSTNGGLPVLLIPRTRVAPNPNAIYASTAGTVASVGNGAIQVSSLATTGAPAAGQVLAYDGSSLTWQSPQTPGNAWSLTGNNAAAGSFLGTLNNRPLELKANSERVLRLEPNGASPNLIAGWSGNGVSPGAIGGTIGGGGVETFFGRPGTNRVTDDFGTVSGGANNVAGLDSGDFHDGWFATVGGGQFNRAEGVASTIGGGSENRTSNNDTTVGGGYQNQAINLRATVSGGQLNVASGQFATISGGQNNTVGADYSMIAGGQLNRVREGASYSVIGGGSANVINSNAFGSFIGGGANNTASGIYSTVPGGYYNEASGDYSFAAGFRAKALYRGAFVWADSQGYDFQGDFRPNSVSFRCLGGVSFTSGDFFGANQTVSWTPGNGSWSFSSDRNLKDRLQSVDPQAVLAKVSRLPIEEWSYKGYSQRHIGAMAQDFHALFPLNDDDKVLNDADLHGVALAAIQGLNLKLEEALQEKDAKIAKLEQEMAGLKSAQRQVQADWDARFHSLQKAVAHMANKSAATLVVNH